MQQAYSGGRMAHQKLAEKLEDYLARRDAGKAHKIRPRDVEKVIAKLRARREELLEDLVRKPDKADRLHAKIVSADDLLARAQWLLAELSGAGHATETESGRD